MNMRNTLVAGKPRRSSRQQGIAPVTGKLVTRRTKAATVVAKEVDREVLKEVIENEDSVEKSKQDDEENSLHNDEDENSKRNDDEENEKHDDDEENSKHDDEERSKHDDEERAKHDDVEMSKHDAEDENLKQNEDAATEELERQPEKKKRKTRGPTKMRGVAKHHEEKVDVEFTASGEPVGKGSVTLSSFLGPLVREHVPVLLDDWRHLDESTKDILWEEVQARFNINEDWQKDSVFRQMGCLWRASKSRLTSKVRNTSRTEIPLLKPKNIQSLSAWKNWVKNRSSEDFKVQSDKFRELKKAQIPHTTSRKGMIRLAHEMKMKSSDPSKVSRSKVWIAGHTHSNGTPVRPEFAETIEQIKSIDSELGSTASTNIREDAVSQVLGRDKSGRLRGMGRGVTATKLAFMQARDAHVQKLEATQTELINTIKDLQNEVRGLIIWKQVSSKRSEEVCMSESSNASKVVTRCQLLDWTSNDDDVVGEGEYWSAEPMYKIDRIPLGPNAAAVLVTSVAKEDAFIWRPTTTMQSLGQAVGIKIAWPADKIILDDLNSPTNNHTAGSSVSLERVTIYDWSSEDVVVAEGIVYSADPKEMVNNIPLGPNAAILKVEKVVVKEAYLWRPISPELFLLGDALHQYIAWPIHKIGICSTSTGTQPKAASSKKASHKPASSKPTQPKAATSKAASPSSVSCRSSPQSKCMLLDVNNSGEFVAEGKLLSTNPEDKVHFVPLGPNASKILVEVVKIGTAEVWKPNSEVEFVSDAMGTTVAWPNDKIVYL